jgi:hypothetical protein
MARTGIIMIMTQQTRLQRERDIDTASVPIQGIAKLEGLKFLFGHLIV